MIQVEIWSDFACPFCYIGKRGFEAALKEFPQSDQVSVVWKSFELDPGAEVNQGVSMDEMLASKYGKSLEWARSMNENVTRHASTLGLKYELDRAIPTNTRDAHRLSKLAAKHGLQDAAEERIFSAYFCEGKHIGDRETLKEIARGIGLDEDEAGRVLENGDFGDEVRGDQEEARQLGISGVPFFVMNRKYAVSGAQPREAFLKALNAAWEESRR